MNTEYLQKKKKYVQHTLAHTESLTTLGAVSGYVSRYSTSGAFTTDQKLLGVSSNLLYLDEH
jgi:hypothetical protein